ncbi:MAG TPA: ABC transporter permease [Gemmatimonadales bacterium]|nr:ABC transporter permease [Gemmatimonadales bacterium]
MIATLRELVRRRDLLYMLALRDIRVRYKQSVMGFLWAILMPGLIVAAGILVRYGFAVSGRTIVTASEMLAVSVKSIPWAFLVGAIRFSSNSLINNTSLVTKIYMPREIFPLAATLAQITDLLVALTLLAVLLVVFHVGASWELLWVIPILLIFVLLVAGWGILLAAASLFFRDVKYIVEVFLTFAIFFTPVFYDSSLFPHYGHWLLLNPVAPLLQGLSATVVYHRAPELPWVAYSTVWALVTCIGGLALFKRLEPYFAESI